MVGLLCDGIRFSALGVARVAKVASLLQVDEIHGEFFEELASPVASVASDLAKDSAYTPYVDGYGL